MYTTVAGVYRNGHVELAERPVLVQEESQVFVTFLNGGTTNLRARGIDEQQAAEIRAQFAAFAPDWDSPEMDIYDRYDEVRKLSGRTC